MNEFTNSWAYIIGIDDYQNGIPPLRTAVNDATQIAAMLERDHGYRVRLFPNSGIQATRDQLTTLLTQTIPAEVGPADRLLFYFAGHGKAIDGDDGPVGVLLPQDAHLDNPSGFVAMTVLHDALAQLPCRHMLLVLDCCFSGSFRWSATRDLDYVPAVLHQERFARYTADHAWQVITSAAADQKAWDFDPEKRNHSPFAAALLQGLQGDADLIPRGKHGQPAGDGVITAAELHLYLREAIEQPAIASGSRQTPGLWPLRKHDKGEYIFLVPGREVNLPPAPDLTAKLNPWRGLQSYEEDHHDLFFGRGPYIDQLREQVSRMPLTIVVGASGTGKSSLVKAGLLPELRKPHSDNWRIIESCSGAVRTAAIRPGKSPMQSLASLIFPGETVKRATSDCARSPEAIAEYFMNRVAEWLAHNEGHLLLFVDQFEELVTLCHEATERVEYLKALSSVFASHAERFRLVISIRSDFESQFLSSPLAMHWVERARFVVPPLSQDELREIIERPAAARVLYFEPSKLVEKLINDVVQTPGVLPLLSFTLSELYVSYLRHKDDNRCLTLEDYDALGGVAGSLRNRATEIYNSLGQAPPDRKADSTTPLQRTMQMVLLRMVSVESGELTRRHAPEFELVYRDPEENQRVGVVLNKLIEARLVVKGREANGEAFVEPAHDALVRGWDKLLEWTQHEHEQLTFRRLLTPAANDWKANPRGAGLWHFNPRLELVRRQVRSDKTKGSSLQQGTDDGWMNTNEAEFIERSAKRRTNILANSIGSIVIAFVALATLTWYAFSERDRATKGRLLVERELRVSEAQRIAILAQSLVGDYPQRATLLAVEAVRMSEKDGVRVRDAEQVLQNALRTCAGYGLSGHHSAVSDIAFSSDGRWLASGSTDGTVRLWDLTSELPIQSKHVLSNLSEKVNCVSISPDSRWLVVAGWSDISFLYDLKQADPTSEPVELHNDHNFIIDAVVFSPDSNLLIAGGRSGGVKGMLHTWVLGEKNIAASCRELDAHFSDVTDLAFSPDGRWLASGCSQVHTEPLQFPLLWDFRHPLQPKGPTLLKHGKEPNGEAAVFGGVITDDVAFAPDSSLLATTSRDGFVRLWTLGNDGIEGEPTTLPANEYVSNACFSPNGRWLAAGGGANTVFLWDLQTNDVTKSVAQLEGGSDNGTKVHFTADNEFLFNTSEHAIKVWNIVGLAEKISDWRRWAADSALTIPAHFASTFHGHEDGITDLDLSPDNQWLATGSADGTCRLQKIDYLKWKSPPTTGISRDSEYYRRAISIDGKGGTLAAARADEIVALWDLTAADPVHSIRLLPHHRHWVSNVELSPDGRMLVSVGKDAKLWTLAKGTGSPRSIEIAPNRYSTVAAFVPDGKWVATGHGDGSVYLWQCEETNANRKVTIFDSSDNDEFDDIDDLAISVDGRRLVAGCRNGELRTWNISNSEAISLPDRFRGFGARVEVSPDGRWLFSSDYPKGKLYDLAATQPAPPCAIIDGWGSVNDACFGPNSNWFAASAENNGVSLWSLSTSPPREFRLEVKDKFRRPFRSNVVIYGWKPEIKTLIFSPNGATLFGGSNDSNIYVWNVGGRSTHPIRHLQGHIDAITSLSISADGRWLLSGSNDNSVRLWDLHDPTGQFSIVLSGEKRSIQAVKISPDGKFACGTSLNNSTSLWVVDLHGLLSQARLAVGRNLTHEEWALYLPGKPYRETFEDLPYAATILTGDEGTN